MARQTREMSVEKLAAMWPETWENRGDNRLGCDWATMSRPVLRVAMAVCDDVTCNGFFFSRLQTGSRSG